MSASLSVGLAAYPAATVSTPVSILETMPAAVRPSLRPRLQRRGQLHLWTTPDIWETMT